MYLVVKSVSLTNSKKIKTDIKEIEISISFFSYFINSFLFLDPKIINNVKKGKIYSRN